MKDWTGNAKSVFVCNGASNHTEDERQVDDYYATEPKATQLLLDRETFSNVISCVNQAYNKNYVCKNVNPVLFKFLQQHNTNIPALFTNKYNTRILKRKINSFYIAFIQDHIYDKNLCNDFCDFINTYYSNIRKRYTDIKSLPFDSLFKDYPKLVTLYCEQTHILNCQRISLYNSIDQFLSISLRSIIR